MGLFQNLFGRVFAPRDVPRSEGTRKPGAYDSEQATKNVREGLIPVVSSWVSGMKWVGYAGGARMGDLFVRFRSGVIVKYQSIDHDLYDDFFSSSSKGRFVHKYLKHKPYTVVG